MTNGLARRFTAVGWRAVVVAASAAAMLLPLHGPAGAAPPPTQVITAVALGGQPVSGYHEIPPGRERHRGR